MLSRRQLLGSLSACSIILHGGRSWAETTIAPAGASLLASPPVAQHPHAHGFGVSVALSGLATAWIEWGVEKDKLDRIAHASDHGLMVADDRAIHIRVQHDEPLVVGQPIYYRVVVQPLQYPSEYRLKRGEPQASRVFTLRLPDPQRVTQTVAVINDTHENDETLQALYRRVEAVDPDLLIWNGDTCNDFDAQDKPEQILLNPLGDLAHGLACTRPLVLIPGNHDVRGARAREMTISFPGWPGQADLPYNRALRLGPLALLTLDTGEDKPDDHPAFAGTANYEPYRAAQARWLERALATPEIADSPFKIALCHIPLRGREGQNDGTTLDGYASFSGYSSRLWLPALRKAKCQCIVSGHTHQPRFDSPSPAEPIAQFVGGGPQPRRARLILIRASEENDGMTLTIESSNLTGEITHRHVWTA